MTPRQSDVLQAIRTHITEKGYPPSVRELCTATGLASTSTVHAHLMALARDGHIVWNPTQPRTLRIPPVAEASARQLHPGGRGRAEF